MVVISGHIQIFKYFVFVLAMILKAMMMMMMIVMMIILM